VSSVECGPRPCINLAVIDAMGQWGWMIFQSRMGKTCLPFQINGRQRHQAVSNRFARTNLLWLDASDKALCWSATGDGVIGKKDNDGSYDRNDHAG
jgi:hypothetical protein